MIRRHRNKDFKKSREYFENYDKNMVQKNEVSNKKIQR